MKPCSAPEERSLSRSAAGQKRCVVAVTTAAAAAVQMVEAALQMKD